MTPFDDLLDDLTAKQKARFDYLCLAGVPPEEALLQTEEEFGYSRNMLITAATNWMMAQTIRIILQ